MVTSRVANLPCGPVIPSSVNPSRTRVMARCDNRTPTLPPYNLTGDFLLVVANRPIHRCAVFLPGEGTVREQILGLSGCRGEKKHKRDSNPAGKHFRPPKVAAFTIPFV